MEALINAQTGRQSKPAMWGHRREFATKALFITPLSFKPLNFKYGTYLLVKQYATLISTYIPFTKRCESGNVIIILLSSCMDLHGKYRKDIFGSEHIHIHKTSNMLSGDILENYRENGPITQITWEPTLLSWIHTFWHRRCAYMCICDSWAMPRTNVEPCRCIVNYKYQHTCVRWLSVHDPHKRIWLYEISTPDLKVQLAWTLGHMCMSEVWTVQRICIFTHIYARIHALMASANMNPPLSWGEWPGEKNSLHPRPCSKTWSYLAYQATQTPLFSKLLTLPFDTQVCHNAKFAYDFIGYWKSF